MKSFILIALIALVSASISTTATAQPLTQMQAANICKDIHARIVSKGEKYITEEARRVDIMSRLIFIECIDVMTKITDEHLDTRDSR